MENYKERFIDFLLEKKALKFGEFKLKSGRTSPYFINTGIFDDGKSIEKLGYFYAAKIAKKEFDIIFGPAYKGIPLAVTTAIALSKEFNINKGYSFNRKEPKTHGEATKQNNIIVGHKIKDNNRILMIDDVFTTGNTKYEAINSLNNIANNLQYVDLIISVDRKETTIEGMNATKQFQKNTGISIDSIVDIYEIIHYLSRTKKITTKQKEKLEDYLKQYGI